MKILYLTDQTYLHGGVEKVLSQKANWFAEVNGDQVFMVTYNQQGKEPVYPFSDKIKWFDLGINYEIGRSYFHPKNLKKIPAHKKMLRKILKEIKPDLIISCSYGPDFFFMNSLEKQIPKIKEFHSSRYLDFHRAKSIKDKILGKLSQRAESKFSSIVVLNPDEVQFYENKKIVIIPNPTAINDNQADLHAKRILAAGRISPVKNFEGLLDIWSTVTKKFPAWELHFYGEDYLGTQRRLEAKIMELGLEKSVRFMGTSEDMKKTMSQYSIYAMTSHTECFPMVLLEALSAGVPIISYDVPTGPKHIITHNEDGYLVSNQDPAAFSKKLMKLMDDENLRYEMGTKGKKNVARFSADEVMPQWADLFLSLTNG